MNNRLVSEKELLAFGERLGSKLVGGAVIELVGDVGAGKTTFTRGLARGLGIMDDIQSPTFTISRIYEAPRNVRLVHYDFYRLSDAGIMAMELNEVMHDESAVTVIEWGDAVAGVLPEKRLTITIIAVDEATRSIELQPGDSYFKEMIGEIT